ncbi:hypothetical protein WM24_23650 [Burkholderia ubonensis]|uniref:zinc-ribbon domain-containing protein n=1 Tax=Burkholderia ubonensis TaxID=101571 RepID=UPI00075B3C38|nr:zinc-ribbon domain-containing protein [Burkholderia ubonensis]KWN80834.1 hypothetical protein WM24_23650 [Burkholderia ubonensis]
MALIKCRECGTEISNKATACVKCGAPVKKPATKARQAIAAILALGFVGYLAIGLSSNGRPAAGSSAKTGKPESDVCKKDDIQCLGDKGIVAASVYCKDQVERLAAHSVRWTDGTFELKFSRFRWADKAAGTITYVGDKAEFQNGFGAYTPVTYECDLAADNKTVLDVRAHEGHLPG